MVEDGRDETVTEVYLGDYVDRGRDSSAVVDRLIARRDGNHDVVLLRGNHENMFQAFLGDKLPIREWQKYGGMETVMSYGVDPQSLPADDPAAWVAAIRALMPQSHLAFLRDLVDSWSIPGYFFAHAGIRPGLPLERQSADDLLWIRDGFLGDPRDHGAVVVHGHTPSPQPEFFPNRINLDTGAYLTSCLSCLRIDENGPALLDY